jgi:hypothetical protein
MVSKRVRDDAVAASPKSKAAKPERRRTSQEKKFVRFRDGMAPRITRTVLANAKTVIARDVGLAVLSRLDSSAFGLVVPVDIDSVRSEWVSTRF